MLAKTLTEEEAVQEEGLNQVDVISPLSHHEEI
jgi:hypothetical protein